MESRVVRAVARRRGDERAGGAASARGQDEDDVGSVLDDEEMPLFSVGQVAELVGMRPWFLRRLDSMGVVTPTRSGAAHRRYSRADIRRLLDARALMRDGVSVAGVRRVLELKDKVAELEEALRTARDAKAASYEGDAEN